MKLLLVDDNTKSMNRLKNLLKGVKGISSILQSNTAENAVYTLLDKKPDILVCSDNLPGKSAFDLAYLIERENIKVCFIMLSGNQAKAIDAIRTKIFDFILTPCSDVKIVESIKRAMDELKQKRLDNNKNEKSNVSKLRLTTTNGYVLFHINSLAYCKADGSYTHLFFNDGRVEYSSYYLGKIEKLLINKGFYRINRSVIVNGDMIEKIDKRQDQCTLRIGDELVAFKISKSQLKNMEVEYTG
jgi:two-component system LytT family response regulator